MTVFCLYYSSPSQRLAVPSLARVVVRMLQRHASLNVYVQRSAQVEDADDCVRELDAEAFRLLRSMLVMHVPGALPIAQLLQRLALLAVYQREHAPDGGRV